MTLIDKSNRANKKGVYSSSLHHRIPVVEYLAERKIRNFSSSVAQKEVKRSPATTPDTANNIIVKSPAGERKDTHTEEFLLYAAI